MTRPYAAALALCIAWNVTPGNAPAAELSCAQTTSPQIARRLVAQCLEVSPATHPPCNAANPCSLIEEEVRRSCAFLDNHAPAFCAEYPRQDRSQPWRHRN